MSAKQDVLDRKGAWVERMFDRIYNGIKENPLAVLLALSVMLNFFVIKLYVDTINKSKEELVAEVRRTVKFETERQMMPIIAQQDSVIKNVDTSLTNINGTVEQFKEYFKSKK